MEPARTEPAAAAGAGDQLLHRARRAAAVPVQAGAGHAGPARAAHPRGPAGGRPLQGAGGGGGAGGRASSSTRRAARARRSSRRPRKRRTASRKRRATQARREAEALLERARSEIQLERDQAIAELRKEFADITVTAAEKVIGQSLDRQGHQRLIEDVLARIDVQGELGAARPSRQAIRPGGVRAGARQGTSWTPGSAICAPWATALAVRRARWRSSPAARCRREAKQEFLRRVLEQPAPLRLEPGAPACRRRNRLALLPQIIEAFQELRRRRARHRARAGGRRPCR